MKAVEEGDELFPARCVHREFQCSLYCFRPTVCEVRSRRRFDRYNRVKFLGELRHVTVIVVSAAHVNQLFCLLLDRLHDFRMTVSGGTDGHSGVAIEKNISVDVFDPNSGATFGDELKRGARVGGGNKLCVCVNDLLTLGAWQRRLDFRALCGCEYGSRHLFLPCQKWASKPVRTTGAVRIRLQKTGKD